MLKNIAIILVSSVTLLGCASRSPESKTVIDRNGLDILATTAGLQPWVVKENLSKEQLCLAPPSDAVVSQSNSIAIPSPRSAISGSPGLTIGSQENDLSLGGRSANVLIVREYLYRLCELALNANLDVETRLLLWRDANSIIKKSLTNNVGNDAEAAPAFENKASKATTQNSSNTAPISKQDSPAAPTELLVF